jgi:anti-anti-sigma factor
VSLGEPAARVAAAEVAPDTYVVRATGLVHDDSAFQLRGVLYPIAATDRAHVLLDLGDAARIDRASLGVIASAARMAHRRGDDLSVITSDPTLATRLAFLGGANLVRFEDSVSGWLNP